MSDLFTVGYESTDLQLFIDCLLENRVTALVDVRDFPGSRKRGFSKTSLATALSAAGITYEHWRQLGAPKEIRHELRKTKNWNEYVKSYSQVLDLQGLTLASLAERAKLDRICLMCFERDYQECHRWLVAERLQSLGLTGQAIHLVPRTSQFASAA